MKLLNQIPCSNENSVGLADVNGNEIFVGEKLRAIIDQSDESIRFEKLADDAKSFLTWERKGGSMDLLLDFNKLS